MTTEPTTPDQTGNLALPLVQPAQAQKHVTVNEALQRLDGLAQLVVHSRSQTTPPAAPPPGRAYGVPAGAVNAWAGMAGQVAIAANGGWVFAQPRAGWRAFLADEGQLAVHDGSGWRAGLVARGASGAGSFLRVVETTHDIAAGGTSTTAPLIPAHCMVFAVTARVSQAITGSLASWRLGTADDTGRYGSGLGLATGAFARGLLGAPMAHYAATALVLTAQGGSFAGGQVRIAVHLYEAGLPDG